MPFAAEFTTDGRSKMLDSGHAPDDDKGAIEKFEEQAIAMAEARPGTPAGHTMAASCIPKAMVTLVRASSRGERPKRAGHGTSTLGGRGRPTNRNITERPSLSLAASSPALPERVAGPASGPPRRGVFAPDRPKAGGGSVREYPPPSTLPAHEMATAQVAALGTCRRHRD
jgi:hypothetical protein